MPVKGVLMVKAAEGVAVEALIERVPSVQERWGELGIAVHNAYPTRWNGDPNCAIALIQAKDIQVFDAFTAAVSNSPLVGNCKPFNA